MVQLELGDAFAVQVPPVTAKSVALGPVIFSLNDSGKPDRLVIVTVLSLWRLRSACHIRVSPGRTVSGIVFPVLSATVIGAQRIGTVGEF